MDVAGQLGEGAIIDCGDGGAQDDRAEDVGAVGDGVGEDREAGEDFDEGGVSPAARASPEGSENIASYTRGCAAAKSR